MALPLSPASLIASALVGALASAMVSLVGRVLLALGISFVAFSGMDTLLNSLLLMVKGNMSGVPSDLAAWFAVLKIQTSISILFSAITTRFALQAVGGVIKRVVFK
ncbi:MAG: DUF2523 domain-containing protein [Azonexus sp.]|jgi:L-cysteine desulfidase|nr:DUF2523 domain-containing protein [Azonexus sp.]